MNDVIASAMKQSFGLMKEYLNTISHPKRLLRFTRNYTTL